MTDVRPPRELATLQDGVIARWQLVRAGLTEAAAEWWVRDMQPLGDGVFLSGLAQPTQRQRWWAAVLSQPGTVLSHASAAACHELRRRRRGRPQLAGGTPHRRAGRSELPRSA